MVDFGYNNNAIWNQKHFKPIANDNVTDGGMIVLTDEPLPCWKLKKEWKFKSKSWVKKYKALTAYLKYLCYFFSYLYKFLYKYHINKKGHFYSHENITSYGIPVLARLLISHFQKHEQFNAN